MTSRSAQPIYRRVRDHFAAQIEQGTLRPHTKLPSERALSNSLNISRMTARQAFVQLEEDGLVYRAGRRGWFVSPPRLHYSLTQSVSFVDNVTTEGGAPLTKVLAKRTVKAPAWVRQRLELPHGTKVHVLRRLRLVGDTPAMVERMYVPAWRFPELLKLSLERSLMEIWAEDYELRVHRSEISLSLAPLPPAEAQVLGVTNGEAGIYLVQTMFDEIDHPVAVEQQYWRGDVAEFTVGVDFG